MSTTTLTRAQRSARDAQVAADVATFNLPDVTTEQRDEVLKAIAAATVDTLSSVLWSQGPVIYANPDAAQERAESWEESAKRLSEDAAKMRRHAMFIIRNARKVDPKRDLLAIGLAVENIDRESADETTIGAVKQRWSRFGLAVDLVALSRESVAAGKRPSAITEDHALSAAMRRTPRGELRKMAKDGLTLPTKDPKPQSTSSSSTDRDDVANVRTYAPSALLNALNTATDRAKHLKRDALTAENVRDILAAYENLKAAIAGVKVAPAETPIPDAETRKSVTPKDVAPKA